MLETNLNKHMLWVAFLALAWLQPDHFPPWGSFHSEVFAFAAFGLLSAAVIIGPPSLPRHRFQLAAPETGVLILLAVAGMQRMWGLPPYSGDTVALAIYLGAMLFALNAGRSLGNGSQALIVFSWMLVLVGLASVAVSCLQAFFPWEPPTFITPMQSWRRPGGNLGQANQLGTLLLWSLASTGYLLWRTCLELRVAVAIGIVLLLGVAMTESRTALLGLLCLALWCALKPVPGHMRPSKVISLGGLGLGLALFVLWPLFLVGFHEGNWSAEVASHGSVNTQVGTRFIVWPQLWAAAVERPWFGWGFRGVSAALNAVLDRYTNSDPFTYAHNLILELMVSFGYPLTALLVTSAIVWLWRRVSCIRNLADWYAVALLIPFALHSMLEFPFAYAYFVLPACFVLGMLDSHRPYMWSMTVPRRLAAGLWITWSVLGLIIVRDYVLAEEDFRVARFEALKIGKTAEHYEQPQLWVLTQLAAVNVATRVVPRPGMSQETMEMLKNAAHRFPWTAIQNRYALSLALNGNVIEAQRQLKVMRVMHGANTYRAIRELWESWAKDKYPQLLGLAQEEQE